MANSLFDNVYQGSISSENATDYMRMLQEMNRGIRSHHNPYYIIRQDESDGRKRIYTNITRKELETILKHIPDVELGTKFQTKWLHTGMDLNDPRNLPCIFPDYDTTRWAYDILYDGQYHEKMLTVLSLWLSMEQRIQSSVSNLCPEITV